MSSSISILFKSIDKIVDKLHDGIRWKSYEKMEIEFEKLKEFLDCLKLHFPKEFVETTFEHVNRHLHFVERYLEEKDIVYVSSNFDDIRKRDLPNVKQKVYAFLENRKSEPSDKEEKVYPKGHVYDFYKDIRDITMFVHVFS